MQQIEAEKGKLHEMHNLTVQRQAALAQSEARLKATPHDAPAPLRQQTDLRGEQGELALVWSSMCTHA